MRILHIAPHLGGGVGKAHASLAEAACAMPHKAPGIRHSYVLLEQPLDVAFAERLRSAMCDLHVAPDPASLLALAAEADIIQIEWWNHPRIYGLLADDILPPTRLVIWSHISGLHAPLIPLGLVEAADRIIFTAQCSLGAANLQAEIQKRPDAFSVINSGFGFEGIGRRKRTPKGSLRCGYVGTLDFVKLHPEIFNFWDSINIDIALTLWGHHDPSGPVAREAARMRFPNRVHFAGFTEDPASTCLGLDVFIYLLRPGHYGTGENSLVEAMSAGSVPIVWDNPAESNIVCDKRTGFVVRSKDEFVSCIMDLHRYPSHSSNIRSAAQKEVAERFSTAASLQSFAHTYKLLMEQPKRNRHFGDALGRDARTWFSTTVTHDMLNDPKTFCSLSSQAAKGSLAHFRACYPEDTSLL